MERVLSFLFLREYSEDGHIVQYQPMSALAISGHESELSASEDKPEDTAPENTGSENTEPENQTAFNNIELFIAADKYEILPLKTLATLKFFQWANTN